MDSWLDEHCSTEATHLIICLMCFQLELIVCPKQIFLGVDSLFMIFDYIETSPKCFHSKYRDIDLVNQHACVEILITVTSEVSALWLIHWRGISPEY